MTIAKDTRIIKVYLPKTLREQFKEVCEYDGVAMSDRLEQFILRMVEKRGK
jgi:hypothetical protein